MGFNSAFKGLRGSPWRW